MKQKRNVEELEDKELSALILLKGVRGVLVDILSTSNTKKRIKKRFLKGKTVVIKIQKFIFERYTRFT